MNPKLPKTATELLARSHKTAWYEVEENTCALLKAVVAHRPPAQMSGDDFWTLMRLTWINSFRGEPVENHWRDLKIPALADFFGAGLPDSESIESAVGEMHLPALLFLESTAADSLIVAT